ncbi:hypothetical protein SLEP1_g41028 [Rubroshorea leprosula]|uniref:Uncharacterized protein n=1 Tax=Rubroshorea leprosula TaxID=152421 RepID=A0AAV5L5I9_9ROSI|nr:hypothetical protein SLEP1_g41028 [Rubroshorea leprosula]
MLIVGKVFPQLIVPLHIQANTLCLAKMKVLFGLEVSDGEGGEGMGTDGKGGRARGAISFLLFGFPKRQRGGRWTDLDSLQPPSNLQICNPPDLEGLGGI